MRKNKLPSLIASSENHVLRIAFLLISLLLSVFYYPAFAQLPPTTWHEKEIGRLVRMRDSENALALVPIEQRFKLASQQLLRKAMQMGNLEAANKLKVMLENPLQSPTQVQNVHSPQERELLRLMVQRDMEAGNATDPIQKRFEFATMQLLRKALQTALQDGDLEAANKIKARIEAARFSAGENSLIAEKNMVLVDGGALSEGSALAGQAVIRFEIGKSEVTWCEWQKVRDWAAIKGYDDLRDVGKGQGENHPVTDVNWYDAVKWCNAKSEMERVEPVYQVNGQVYKTGDFGQTADVVKIKNSAKGYRLPSEAEWEWSARGGKKSKGYTYSGSNDLGAVGWFDGNAGGSIHPVRQKHANELGIYDMSGNVWEWCFDAANASPVRRIIRGGSWDNFAAYCPVAARDLSINPDSRRDYFGFRFARNSGN